MKEEILFHSIVHTKLFKMKRSNTDSVNNQYHKTVDMLYRIKS